MKVKYLHPVVGSDGKRLSTANIVWAERNLGSAYYRVSRFAMRGGKFPHDHPCAPLDTSDRGQSQIGSSPKLAAFRALGYWASCFPEGDGITLRWWDGFEPLEKTEDEVKRDIRECFGWDIE